ncbi:MAG: hypothetical protein C0483_18580 [Pirellula sp.]|nr:hypothetical protein [Pirellula sp.]
MQQEGAGFNFAGGMVAGRRFGPGLSLWRFHVDKEQRHIVTESIKRLSASERGKSAMRQVLAWLDNDGLSLDDSNKDAIVALLISAWEHPGTVRDKMREAIGQNGFPHA